MQQHLERWSENMCGLRVKNVCFLKCKKKSDELEGSVSIYRGQKTLKIVTDDYGLNSNASFCEKVEKGVPYCHSKAIGPKPTWWQFGTFRVPFSSPKVPNWLLEAKCTFVFGCHLVFPSRVFWLVFVPRRVFNLRLWFFLLSFFWIIQNFSGTIIL